MREKRVCSRCGSGFFVSKNDIKRGRGVYCSISCSSAALNERQQKHPALKSGDRFHMLVLIEPLAKGRQPTWKVRCDCGVEKVTRAARLFGSRPLLSCGCYRKPRIGDPAAATRKPTYRIWANMKRRATNTDDPLYAGRGIGICDRWRHGENGKTGFECFLADMGDRPSRHHSIDRIDNDGDYAPANCRWATAKEQARNRSQNIFVDVNGARLCLMDAVPLLNPAINYDCVLGRIEKGWDMHDAIFEPKMPGKPLRTRDLRRPPKSNGSRHGSYTFTHRVSVVSGLDHPLPVSGLTGNDPDVT